MAISQLGGGSKGDKYKYFDGDAPEEFALNPNLNEWLDEQCEPVRIMSLSAYRPSEVLFNVDPVAYRDLLTGDKANDETEDHTGDTDQDGGPSNEYQQF